MQKAGQKPGNCHLHPQQFLPLLLDLTLALPGQLSPSGTTAGAGTPNSSYYQISIATLHYSLNQILGTQTRRADTGRSDHEMAQAKRHLFHFIILLKQCSLLLTCMQKREQTHHRQSLTVLDASVENFITICQGLPASIFSGSLLNTELTEVSVFHMHSINAI